MGGIKMNTDFREPLVRGRVKVGNYYISAVRGFGTYANDKTVEIAILNSDGKLVTPLFEFPTSEFLCVLFADETVVGYQTEEDVKNVIKELSLLQGIPFIDDEYTGECLT
jgi:hypothetical protein